MSIGYFCDKEHQPTQQELCAALGTKQILWQKLTQFIFDNYQLSADLSYGGKNYGWNLWYRKSGQSLVSLYPQKGYLVAQVVLGKDQVAQAETLKLGKTVRKTLAETPQLHDGRWLFVKVKTEKDVKDIEALLQLKRKPRPQK